MEADTILFYIYSQLRRKNVQDIVVIDAEDTDVIVMAAHIAHEVEGKLYLKKRNATYDCRTMCNTQLVKIIVPLHIHSGADAISAFYGHGKKSIVQSAIKSEDSLSLLYGKFH